MDDKFAMAATIVKKTGDGYTFGTGQMLMLTT